MLKTDATVLAREKWLLNGIEVDIKIQYAFIQGQTAKNC